MKYRKIWAGAGLAGSMLGLIAPTSISAQPSAHTISVLEHASETTLMPRSQPKTVCGASRALCLHGTPQRAP